MFIAIDLDGTLCDGSHKAALLKHPEKPGDAWPEQDWASWLEASIDDELVQEVAFVANAFIEAGHHVEFWTGRGEHARDVTQRWMAKHGYAGIALRMRAMDTPQAANEPDHIAKMRFLLKYGKPDLIIEDKASVVQMWRDFGITCWQVAEGNY